MQLDWNLFIKCIVTGDETWIRPYDPGSEQQSIQWKHATSSSPGKFKVQARLCALFSGMLKVYCWLTLCFTKRQLQGFTTLTYFTNCLRQLKRSGKESCPRCHYFCTTVTSHAGQAALHESRFEEICNPPYSDLVPNDCHLFQNLNKHLHG